MAEPAPVEDLVSYLRENRDRYTQEALTTYLRDAGHSPEAVAAAWATLEAEAEAEATNGAPAGVSDAEPSTEASTTRQSVLQGIAILLALAAGAIGTYALLAMANNRPAIILYLVLFPLQIILVTRWFYGRIAASESLRSGDWVSTIGWLLAPPIVLAGLMGVCFGYGATFGCLLHC